MTDTRRQTTLSRRLVTRFTFTVVAVLGVLGVVLDQSLERAFLDDLTLSLTVQARAVRAGLDDGADRQSAVAALARETGVRITLILTDGTVVADSERDPERIENHRSRPEVRAALAGGVGVASRTSATVGEPFRYVALPPRGGEIVRVAMPLGVVNERLARVRTLIAGAVVLAALAGAIAVWLVSRRIAQPLRRLSDSVARLGEGDLETRAVSDGTSELSLLAQTLNRMAQELRRRIEEAQGDRATRDLILASMDEGILLVEGDGAISYANAAASRLLGGVPDHVRGLRPETLRQAIRTGEAESGVADVEVQALSGRTLRASAIPIGPGTRVLVVLRDVTAARRLEAVRRDFVTNASHELKTPASVIQASAETVRRAVEDDPASAAHFARQIESQAQQLSALVADLLDLSRLEEQEVRTELIAFDEIVRHQVERFSERARERGVSVEADLEAASVRGSAGDLALLVANLLDNAVRYTSEGGSITVTLRLQDGVVLEVRDTGAGIPSRDLPRIFERFYRVDRARSRATAGTGLGLAIAKHIVEQHGGLIEAESELGRGTGIRITLPTVKEPVVRPSS